jgi:galactonate dehydratase
MEDFYQARPDDAARFADLARQAVAEGFTAFKAMAVPETQPIEGLVPVRYAAACVQAMREAVGDSIDIMVDCHARPSPRMGHLFAAALEPYGLYFLEEPCWPESMDDLAAIQRSVRTPIATGERLVGLAPFRDLLEKRGASVLQPDLTHCGGLTEGRRIAALAEAYRVGLAPHNPQGPVSTAASIEFGFATPSYLICESVHADVPWRDDVVNQGFTVEPKGRIARPNARPGLGVEINEDAVRAHPFEQEILQRSFYRDGSVGDW